MDRSRPRRIFPRRSRRRRRRHPRGAFPQPHRRRRQGVRSRHRRGHPVRRELHTQGAQDVRGEDREGAVGAHLGGAGGGGHRDDARPRELSRSGVSARRDVPQGRVDVRPGLRRRRRTRTGGDAAGARNARVRRAREDRQTGNDEPFAFFVSAFASPLLVPLRLARSSSSTGNNRDTSSCSAPPLVSAPDRTAGTPWSCRRSPP